jgi:hypothetical protein
VEVETQIATDRPLAAGPAAVGVETQNTTDTPRAEEPAAVGGETEIDTDEPPQQERRYGDRRAIIVKTHILDDADHIVSRMEVGGSYRFRFVVKPQVDLEDEVLGLLIRTPRGSVVVGTDTRFQKGRDFPSVLKAGRYYNFDIAFINNLAPGTFFLTASIALLDETKLDIRFDCLSFEVFSRQLLFYTNSLVSFQMTFSCHNATGGNKA